MLKYLKTGNNSIGFDYKSPYSACLKGYWGSYWGVISFI